MRAVHLIRCPECGVDLCADPSCREHAPETWVVMHAQVHPLTRRQLRVLRAREPGYGFDVDEARPLPAGLLWWRASWCFDLNTAGVLPTAASYTGHRMGFVAGPEPPAFPPRLTRARGRWRSLTRPPRTDAVRVRWIGSFWN
jgi:hypothetical protein